MTEKYQSMRVNLRDYFELPSSAVEFVIAIEQFSQFFDDVADKDHDIARASLNLNLYNCFYGLHVNAFFLANRARLLPIMELIVLKWQGSDARERVCEADAVSFVWRAGFYDLLMAVMGIVHGHAYASERAPCVMKYYKETFEDYQKEFPNG